MQDDYAVAPFPKTLTQIQTIVDVTINLNTINNYFGYGYGAEPDKRVFDLAGINGVTDLNIVDIIAHLQTEYGGGLGGGPGGGPGGGLGGSLTPMSTKQEIQEVIDNYLNSL
ncbi:hypothetical protein EBB07_05455 [Paenibacillaceae bacterium]|nr:hypothetical protein EBB07_05455 [Paenibacillaceae bacterium]